MCNLYSIKVDPRTYFDALDAADDAANVLQVEKDYAAPGKPGYVVRVEDGQRVLSTMRWGFPTRKPRKRPAREGELPFLYDWWTNARNMQSGMWKPWLMRTEHRCLVPFSRFSEPKAVADRKGPGDTAWWFTVEDQPVPCVNRRPKTTPYRRAKETPFVERCDGCDGRTIRAGCGVGRAQPDRSATSAKRSLSDTPCVSCGV